ncbi:hypothetical protein SERLA73DRAFT_175253 [Serpula lacrymans var. lacrymans S7.3]|uniref:Uncharacterized protein n=2 Tax=Serpula lacrymans var. lacrymans TaxID=341189 RepID=F8PIP5_SERL3|nr:uncharacterized protein SERLADRAFT_457417 [Serpula lacrymans var. lacrymans S7.9]EGO03678.1 hypothetical protein SERLA73DRAFT_175253 [Serpula lacrymans var. lacrymans S7.3]EGO29541.1 hypothetical protein SERLADRAFT_457417 [Serpula lacrymans var. lacrymans S7.9]
MVDWQSPAEVAKDGAAFSKFMHTLLGLYIWEFVTSLDFDWQFISGKKRFRWPLIFYFAGRYCLFFALIGIAIALNVTTPVNCQSLYTFNQVLGNAAIGLASINLSLRTIAVWSQNRYIVVPLIVIILGHWSFLLHGILLKAEWVPGTGCVITSTSNRILAISFIYSMTFDFTVLCLTGWKLAFPSNGRSKLITLIFGDGLIYFIIAFLANLLATIFMLLNLNAVMSIIANVPAAIASTIVACRAVRRLTNYTAQGPEVFATTTQGSTLAFRSNLTHTSRRISMKKGDHVHVQVDTFTDQGDKPLGEYDATGKIIKGDEFDPEAQIISDEFKRPPY